MTSCSAPIATPASPAPWRRRSMARCRAWVTPSGALSRADRLRCGGLDRSGCDSRGDRSNGRRLSRQPRHLRCALGIDGRFCPGRAGLQRVASHSRQSDRLIQTHDAALSTDYVRKSGSRNRIVSFEGLIDGVGLWAESPTRRELAGRPALFLDPTASSSRKPTIFRAPRTWS